MNNELQKQNEEFKIKLDNLPSIDLDMANVHPSEYKGANDVKNYLDMFARFLNISKRITSENTKKTYLGNTKQFLLWCNKLNMPINSITDTVKCRNLVICYETALSKTDLSQNSRAIKQMSIKKFFFFWSVMNEKNFSLDVNKCFSADWTSSPDGNAYKRQTRINKDVFDSVKAVANAGDLNDKIIFYLISYGCRRSEIVAAKIKDVDFLNKEINLYQSKTKETKKIPCPSWLTQDTMPSDWVYLVCNNSKRSAKVKGKEPCSAQYIYSRIKFWLSKTEYKNIEITPHSFRRYLCSSLLQKGYSESNIAGLSGHKSLQMVHRYGFDKELKNNPIISNNEIKE